MNNPTEGDDIMRYAIKIDTTNPEASILIELGDYTECFTDLINTIMWDSDMYFDIIKLIRKGVDHIVKREGISYMVVNRQIVALREDEFADYQLYIEPDFDRYTIYKVHFDLEEIKCDGKE